MGPLNETTGLDEETRRGINNVITYVEEVFAMYRKMERGDESIDIPLLINEFNESQIAIGEILYGALGG